MTNRTVTLALAVALCATLAAGANAGAVGRPGEGLPLMMDVAVEILSPRDTEEPGLVPVTVKLTNIGDVPALVERLDVTIRPSQFYPDFVENISVGVGAQQVLAFGVWSYSGGTETCTAWITYAADENHHNDTDIVIVHPIAGLQDRVEKKPHTGMSLALSPSPIAGTVLHVEYGLNQAGPASVALFDASGREVLSHDFVGNRTGEFPLGLRRLSGGVYIVRLADGRSAITQKLVIQR